MKLRNNMKDVRALIDKGRFIEVNPGETVEVERPVFNDKVFQIINDKNRKEIKTFNVVKKDKLNKEDK